MAQKLFTRERFREVKGMDREQMERFVHEVFDRGYDSGYRAGLEQGGYVCQGYNLGDLTNDVEIIGNIHENPRIWNS